MAVSVQLHTTTALFRYPLGRSPCRQKHRYGWQGKDKDHCAVRESNSGCRVRSPVTTLTELTRPRNPLLFRECYGAPDTPSGCGTRVATTVRWATHDKVTVTKTRATSLSGVGSGPASLPFLHLILQSASGSHDAFNFHNPAGRFKPWREGGLWIVFRRCPVRLSAGIPIS
jgi:hypothetical protein